MAPQFTLGDSSRNPVRGPGYQDVDLALVKRIPIGSGSTVLELRVGAFNLTNTPPLGAPNAVLEASGFGSITTAGDPRVIHLGLKVSSDAAPARSRWRTESGAHHPKRIDQKQTKPPLRGCVISLSCCWSWWS